MADLRNCLFLEWGWIFWAALGFVVLLVCGVLGAFLVLIARGGWNSLALGYEKWKLIAKGAGVTGVVTTVVLIVLAGVAVYQGYEHLKNSYFVALNTPAGVILEDVRNKFQGDTHITITIKEPAKKFLVVGSYRGACVPDLFDSICRQYSSQLFCDKSWMHGTLDVDLRKSN